MAKAPIESVLAKWQTRAATAKAQGLPDAAWKGLAQKDVKNVMAGGSPMADQEVNVAMLSQLFKQPVIKDPTQKTHIQNIPGNVASDVGGIITGFIPGVARYLHHLPSEATNTLRAFTDPQYAKEQGYEQSSFTPSGMAKAARNVAKLPLLQALPVVHTLAGLTTSEGRKQLERHPVGTALDILPVAAEAGSKLADLKLGGEAAAPGSALEALQKGKLARAGARGISEAVKKVSGGRFDMTDAVNQRLMNATLHPDIREKIQRPFSVIAKKSQREAIALWKQHIEPVVGNLPMEERAQLATEAEHYNPLSTDISPAHHAIIAKLREVNQMYLERGTRDGSLINIPLPNGKSAVYAMDQPVVDAFTKATNEADRVMRKTEKVRQLKETLQERTDRLMERSGKVRKFMESPEDFAARTHGAVGIDAVREAMQPLRESFQHLDPRQVFGEYLSKILDGSVRRQAAARIGQDMAALEGEQGLFAKMDEALQSSDIRSASKAASQIARIFRHKSWDGFDTTTNLRSFMSDVREELVGLRNREKAFGYARRKLETATRNVARESAKLDNMKTRLGDRTLTYMKQLVNNPPAAFHPIIEEAVRNGAVDAAREMFQGQELDSAIKTLRETPSTSTMEDLVGKDTFRSILQSSTQMWLQLSSEGIDPLWMHHVEPGQYEHLMNSRPLPDRLYDPSHQQAKTFNFAPRMNDIAAGVTATGVELIRQTATQHYINDWVMQFAEDRTAKLHEYMDMLRSDPRVPTATVQSEAKRLLEQEYSAFDPAQYGVRSRINVASEGMVIPKGVHRALQLQMKDYKLPLTGAYSKTLNLYKFSVLTGPRHIVHVGIGGMTMAVLREPGTLAHIGEAIKMVREGRAPIELLQPLYDIPTDGVFHYKAGQTMGRHFVESVGSAAKALGRFEEFIANVERTATMLSAESRGIGRDAAMQQALKVYIDMDGMSPLERTVIRNVFPFYAFTRHIFRYLFTYPVDHPVRAAILARFGEQEQADWKSGLPKKYQQLFFLGKPDASGNVMSIDFRSVNPFRSIANDFSLSGFISSLNPIITAPFAAAGVNTLSATPDLYPEVSYDPQTGSLQAKRQDVLPTVLESFVPQVGVLDHFVQMTASMKRLKQSSPDAYRRQLFSNLNLPFAVGTVNVPLEESRTEINRFKAAQQELAKAKKTGDFSEVNRFNLVPSNKKVVAPQTIEQLIEQLRAKVQVPGVNVVAAVPKKALG